MSTQLLPHFSPMLRAVILLLACITISTAYNVPLTRSTFLKRATGVATVVIGAPSWSFAEEGKLAGVYSDPNVSINTWRVVAGGFRVEL